MDDDDLPPTACAWWRRPTAVACPARRRMASSRRFARRDRRRDASWRTVRRTSVLSRTCWSIGARATFSFGGKAWDVWDGALLGWDYGMTRMQTWYGPIPLGDEADKLATKTKTVITTLLPTETPRRHGGDHIVPPSLTGMGRTHPLPSKTALDAI
ncbi:hypothetical protein RI054_31g123790 [Pseudoscourfieldia marina]